MRAHSFIEGHLGRPHLLTGVNDASVDMGIRIALRDSAFGSPGYKPQNRAGGAFGDSVFNFGGGGVGGLPFRFLQQPQHPASSPARVVLQGGGVVVVVQ